MNSPLHNQNLRNNSGPGMDLLRSGTAGTRQVQAGLLGTDDNALHFKRMLSEYKLSEAAPPPPMPARPAQAPTAASKESTQPAEAGKLETKQSQEARHLIRRNQARSPEPAQGSKAPPGRTSADAPAARSTSGAADAAAETQAEGAEGAEGADRAGISPQDEQQAAAGDATLIPVSLTAGASQQRADDAEPLATQDRKQGAGAQAVGDALNASPQAEQAHALASSKAGLSTGYAPTDSANEGEQPADLLSKRVDRQDASGSDSLTTLQASVAQPLGADGSTGAKTARSADFARMDRRQAVERGGLAAATASPSPGVSGGATAVAAAQVAGPLKTEESSFAQDLRQALSSAQHSSTHNTFIESAAALGSETLHGLNKGSEAGEPAVLRMSRGLHEASFAPELGARLSVLAADGIQEAQLHLNPAELGPVAIQIVLEGQQAQISFHAEHAETRQVLEQGLPDLAAALRDAGLTLSGGGVFEQARDPSNQEQARSKGGTSRALGKNSSLDAALTGQPLAPTGARRSQGVLDLYA